MLVELFLFGDLDLYLEKLSIVRVSDLEDDRASSGFSNKTLTSAFLAILSLLALVFFSIDSRASEKIRLPNVLKHIRGELNQNNSVVFDVVNYMCFVY